jgi:crotonobetainyl-CoA:carnitine CoA-transferase CaiB-like acyl-CoA transferase
MANREGYALELRDYDWPNFDVATSEQKEFTRVEDIIGQFYLTKTKADLFQEAVKESMLLCPVTTAKDVMESAQLAHRQYWVKVPHPELDDTITYPGAPVKVGIKPWRIWRRPPLIGEHNAEVYEQELGLTRAELTALKSRGVI